MSSRPLRHPVFLASLALLIVNDHVLKGAGLLPGWLTGKLSDFAGLVVAPIVVATLIGARSRAGRALALALPSALLVALKLSPAIARAYDGLFHALGLPSSITSDPTDLVALSVLPLAAHLLRPSRNDEPQPLRPALSRAALAVALFACVATSMPDPEPQPYQTTAALANLTGGALDVRLRWTDRTIDCASIEASDVGRLIDRGGFGEGITFHLEADRTVPIEQAAARAALNGTRVAEPAPDCELVLISADGLPETVVFIPTSVRGELEGEVASLDEIGGGVAAVAVLSATTLSIETNGAYATQLASPPGPACGAGGEPLARSLLAPGERTITSLALGIDGCLELGLWGAIEGELPPAYFCGGAELFPFAEGENVRVTSGPDYLEMASDVDNRRIRWYARAQRVTYGPFDLEVRSGEPGCWRREPCGAYVRAAALVEHAASVQPATGAVVTAATPGGSRARLLVLRADQVVASGDDCGDGFGAIGRSMDVVIAVDEGG